MARFCSQCGTEIQTGSKFCMKCGKNIESDLEEGESVQNSSVSVAQNKSPGNNKLIPILIIALIVIGCIGGYFFLKRSSDVKKSTAQSQIIETQQTEKSNESAPAAKLTPKEPLQAHEYSSYALCMTRRTSAGQLSHFCKDGSGIYTLFRCRS